MKVLIVNTVSTERNGVTNVIFNYYRTMGISDIQMDLVVINQPDSYYMEEVQDKGGEIYILSRTIRHPLEYIWNLSRIAKEYDVMHVHGNSTTMLLEMLAAKIANVPFRIAHSHNTNCRYKFLNRLCRLPFYALCNGRLACGREAGVWLYGEREFKVLNNGIDTVRFSFDEKKRVNMRQQLKWANNIIMGHIGNFVEAKNHTFLIDVFAEVYRQNSCYRLLLIGDGQLKYAAQTKVMQLGLSNVVFFAGETDSVVDYLCAMDLIVMPSRFEGFPLTLVEEQANGLHCVISDVITHEIDITGLIHFISLHADIDEWVKEILNYSINNNRKFISENAIITIKKNKYDIGVLAKELASFYINKGRV